MIDEKKYLQYGFPREQEDIKGICIHETDNYTMSAKDLFKYLNEESKTNQGCHYLIDSEDVIQVMPNDWGVYHTGKANDWGNKFCIAIEICSNINDLKYQSAQDKAVDLIKQLMEDYAITKDSIFFHHDFNDRVYCPKTILRKYGSSKRFVIDELESEDN